MELKRQKSFVEDKASEATSTMSGEPKICSRFLNIRQSKEIIFLRDITADKGVEANFLEEKDQIHGPHIIICNRYIYSSHGEAETQAFFPEAPRKLISTRKVKRNNKKVGTDKVINGQII